MNFNQRCTLISSINMCWNSHAVYHIGWPHQGVCQNTGSINSAQYSIATDVVAHLHQLNGAILFSLFFVTSKNDVYGLRAMFHNMGLEDEITRRRRRKRRRRRRRTRRRRRLGGGGGGGGGAATNILSPCYLYKHLK